METRVLNQHHQNATLRPLPSQRAPVTGLGTGAYTSHPSSAHFCPVHKEQQKVPGHGRLRTNIQLLEVLRRAQEFYDPSRNHPAPQSYHSYQAHSSLAPPQTFNQLRVLSANKPTSPNTRKYLRAHRLQQSISRCSSSEHTLFPIFASMSSPFANGYGHTHRFCRCVRIATIGESLFRMELNGSRPHWPSCDDGSDSNATCSVFRSLRRKRSLCYQMKVATLAVPVATCPSPLFLLPIPFQSPHSICDLFDKCLLCCNNSIS
ncbi:hypothetical protein J6590_084004 [Homalodisca vitripennis]|nr:hypothetical protein J6590_084004 [Homalodisca vitripennis]